MITRRDFLGAAAAASAICAAGGLGPLARAAARQTLTQADILRFEAAGRATILFTADLHAQLTPLHFREPAVNPGVGAARGLPPHLTGEAFRQWFSIAAGGPEAFAFTADDFIELARVYGRMGGVDRIATLVNAVRAERGGENVLLLDGGDALQGSWSALRSQGQDMVDVLSALGVEAMTGHWEFTYGAERVKQIAETAPFAFLAQNIRDVDWREPVFAPRTLFEKGDARIAVIGEALPRAGVTNPRWMFPNWEFGIREDDLQREVQAARTEGANVVVLLSHCGYDLDRKLAARVRGIDIILCAHTHDALPALTRVGDTALVAAGSHGKFVARLDLDMRAGKLADIRFKLMPVFADAIAPDAQMAALVTKLRAPFAAELAQVYGHAEALLSRRGAFNGGFDDLICQAMMRERDTEFALSPGFRWGAALLPGDAVTFEAITNATAITYPACYRSQMTGAQIKALLEDVADNIFNPDPYYQSGGDMVRAGGFSYAIDLSQPIGARISDLTHVKTGALLDASRAYTVSGWASLDEHVQGPPIWDVVRDYVARDGAAIIEPGALVRVVGD